MYCSIFMWMCVPLFYINCWSVWVCYEDELDHWTAIIDTDYCNSYHFEMWGRLWSKDKVCENVCEKNDFY